MSGIFGGSAAGTDRGNSLADRQGLWNIFNFGMPAGQAGEAKGQGTLDTSLDTLGGAKDYWNKLLTAGRSDTAARSAPAINAALDQGDAARRQAGQMGTGRTGGTAAINREAGTATNEGIDSIINQNLITGREAGASGLAKASALEAGVGGTELSTALANLGLSSQAIDSLLGSDVKSQIYNRAMDDQTNAGIGGFFGKLLMKGLGF